MKRQKITMALILICLIFGAGCIRTHPGDVINVEYYGPINSTGDGIEMTGEIAYGGGVPPRETYRDLHICLLTENREIVHKEAFGDWGLEPLSVSINVDTTPKYIIIDSPDFWNGKTEVGYYVHRGDNTYRLEYTTSKQDLPYTDCV